MITSTRSTRLALLTVLTLGFTSVMAQTLYKLVDKKGNVAYSEWVPKDFDGQVTRLQIDSNMNAVLPPPRARPDGGARAETNEEIIRRRPPNNDDQIEAARLKVEAAQKAFEDARDNSTPEDWQVIGFGRRFPKPAYEARLVRLEQEVKLAEEELKKLERSLW